jgi:hypothetical protein
VSLLVGELIEQVHRSRGRIGGRDDEPPGRSATGPPRDVRADVRSGMHLGEVLSGPPTGRRVDFRSMVFNRFANGVVIENWGLHDHARVLDQLRVES